MASPPILDRIALRSGTVLGLLALALLACKEAVAPAPPVEQLARGAPPPSPVIALENQNPGTRDWFSADADRAAPQDLTLWASPYDALPGDTIDVFVHARYGPVRLSLYRLGWYGGTGGRLLLEDTAVVAGLQPACSSPSPGPVYCPWSRTARLPLSVSWPGGIYLVKATDSRSKTWSYPFVVTDRRKAAITALVPLFTWQAYNGFGGGSLYIPDSTTGHLGHTVSFERPYLGRGGGTYVYGSGYSNDISAVHWLERNGYDVSYITDADLAGIEMRAPAPYRILAVIGHAEYWTWNEYTFVQQLRDRGVHLAFLSGNNAYWNVRSSEGVVTGRPWVIITCYKNQPDQQATTREETTGLFRSTLLDRPENSLYGVMHFAHAYGSFSAVVSDSGQGEQSRAFLSAAGLNPGDTLKDILSLPTGSQAMSSIEGDRIADNGRGPEDIQVLLRSSILATTGTTEEYHTTFFLAPSGAGVFASGFNEWGRWLDDWYSPGDSRIQELTQAVFEWMLVR